MVCTSGIVGEDGFVVSVGRGVRVATSADDEYECVSLLLSDDVVVVVDVADSAVTATTSEHQLPMLR